MPAQTLASTWPSGWPSHTPSDEDPNDTFQRELKQRIIAEYGADALKRAWIKTCHALNNGVTSSIAAAGSAAVPVFSYDEVVAETPEVLARMKSTGCFIVRNVIPEAEATQHFEDLQSFIAANKGVITGWPAKNPAIFHLYSSPVQLKLRTHPHHLNLQRLLNSLFSDPTLASPAAQAAQAQPILYPDALRVRQPGQEFLGLGPHIDAGSLARWGDPDYLKTYHAILSGEPESYDPYDLTYRRSARPGIFPGGAHCSILRTFQGWTALTPCAPGEGGLMLLPDIHTVTAYMILRPFFTAPSDEQDWEDPENWTIDNETAWFPGTWRWDSQLLSPASHPHLRLEQTLVSIPYVGPGDTVWWHADMCHAVETTHNGLGPASVVYIPSAPSTPRNKEYISGYWADLLAGNPPEDYKYLDGTGDKLVLSQQNERTMVGALDIGTISAEGRRALGEGVHTTVR